MIYDNGSQPIDSLTRTRMDCANAYEKEQEMNYMEEWAKANLSPEGQQKFFEEQKKIVDDIVRIEAWHFRPEEAMNLTPEQIAFLRKHEIVISTAYIGMVRFYIGNRTIFQTSAMASIIDALSNTEFGSKSVIDYESLTRQTHEYLNLVMSAPEDVQARLLQNHMPLFGAGEMDQIREICRR